jgi:hypothetical protein
MTFNQAIEFFAVHGNVSQQCDRLVEEIPTKAQLLTVAEYATKVRGQSREIAMEAANLLIKHFNISS